MFCTFMCTHEYLVHVYTSMLSIIKCRNFIWQYRACAGMPSEWKYRRHCINYIVYYNVYHDYIGVFIEMRVYQVSSRLAFVSVSYMPIYVPIV